MFCISMLKLMLSFGSIVGNQDSLFSSIKISPFCVNYTGEQARLSCQHDIRSEKNQNFKASDHLSHGDYTVPTT